MTSNIQSPRARAHSLKTSNSSKKLKKKSSSKNILINYTNEEPDDFSITSNSYSTYGLTSSPSFTSKVFLSKYFYFILYL